MPSRRQFLQRCSTVALTTSVFPVAVMAESLHGTVELSAIRYASFAKQNGTLFHVLDETGFGVFVRLIEVKPVLASIQSAETNVADAQTEKFSLLFSGQSDRPLSQGAYVFEHFGIGRFEMFIVPVGPANSGPRYYEAVFNRPVGAASMAPGPTGSSRNKNRTTTTRS